jgi:hypothetical protein
MLFVVFYAQNPLKYFYFSIKHTPMPLSRGCEKIRNQVTLYLNLLGGTASIAKKTLEVPL